MSCYVQGYVKSDGTKVHGYWRGTPCSDKPKVIPPLAKGTLGKYGYENVRNTTAPARHTALKRAITGYAKENKVGKYDAALSVFRKLNAIATLKKNTLPHDSELHKRDARWIKREYLS